MAAVYTDPLITEIIARNDTFKRGMREARAVYATEAQTIERRSAALATNLERDLARSGMASRNLGFQISDIGAQLAAGSSPFIVLAQQAPQVANALEGTAGVAGRLAAFFSGPWGAALLAAASVVGVLTGKLLEAKGAGEEAAQGYDTAAEAAARFKQVLDGIRAGSIDNQAVGLAQVENQGLIAARDRTLRRIRGLRGRENEALPALSKELADINAQISRNETIIRAAEVAQRNQERLAKLGATAPATTRAPRLGRSIEKEQRALEESLSRITDALDPAQTAAAAFRDTIVEIDRLEGKGLINSAQAATFRFEAARQQAEAVAKAATDRMAQMDRESGFNPDKIIAQASARLEAERDVNDQLADQQQEGVRLLASLYEDLLTGGTDRVWDRFKRIGIAVIAETLARFTLSGGQGGLKGLASSLATGFQAAFGRTSGGYVAPRQTVRINEQRGGAEFLRMGSQGGTVIPLGQINQAASRAPAGGGMATVRLELSGDIDARIQSVSGGVALEVVRAAAPTIVDVAARETTARLTRPRL